MIGNSNFAEYPGEYKIRPYKGFQDRGMGSAWLLCSPASFETASLDLPVPGTPKLELLEIWYRG